jgi:hypothetical protein
MLVDNGLFGDQKAADGIYTLQTSVSRNVALGAKDIPVAVANKKGWLALAKTSLDIKKNPAVTGVKFIPERVLADGRTLVTITVAIDNPGRLEDIESVSADLRGLGLTEREKLKGAGGNAWSLEFIPGSGISAGTYAVSVQAANTSGGLGVGEGTLTVYK